MIRSLYFLVNGINQWQNNYPNIETVKNDISKKNVFVLLEDNTIVASVAVSFDGERNYESIYNGRWISNDGYAVIHSIKVDTHKENVSMQRLLHKTRFQYCGIIYLEDKSERIAFEKTL